MTTAKDRKMEPGRKGRRTVAEEIDLYLEQHGATREQIENPEHQPTHREMRDQALRILFDDYKNLTGVARVQAFKAIEALAKDTRDNEPEPETEPTIADVINGTTLLTGERKKEILTVALERLDLETKQIKELLGV